MQHLEVVLRDTTDSAGNSRRLVAYIAENGDLVFDTQDMGPNVEAVWGSDDYEYSRRIKADLVPRVLLELLKDRFESDREIRRWLESKGIRTEFSSWP